MTSLRAPAEASWQLRGWSLRSNGLVVVIVLAAIFQNYHDLTVLMTTGQANLLAYEGPLVFKLMKDAIMAFLMATCLVVAITGPRNLFTEASLLCFAFIALLFVLSLFSNGLLVALSGLRWFAPIALFLLLRVRPLSFDIVYAARIMSLSVVGCLALQCYQLFYMPPFYGFTLFGLSGRVPGFFLVPNTTAFYVCVSAALSLAFEPRKDLKVLAVLAAVASTTLTQSGTGFVAIAALVCYALLRRAGFLSLPVAALAVILVFVNLDYITGREGLVGVSGGDRIRIIFELALPAASKLDCFGCFTNAAALLLNKAATMAEGQVLAFDSFIASVIGNLGLFLLPVALCVAVFTINSCRKAQWRRLAPLLLVYALFSLTTIVTEAFPMSILLPLLIWGTLTTAHYSAARSQR
jgi:hypothetical protein